MVGQPEGAITEPSVVPEGAKKDKTKSAIERVKREEVDVPIPGREKARHGDPNHELQALLEPFVPMGKLAAATDALLAAKPRTPFGLLRALEAFPRVIPSEEEAEKILNWFSVQRSKTNQLGQDLETLLEDSLPSQRLQDAIDGLVSAAPDTAFKVLATLKAIDGVDAEFLDEDTAAEIAGLFQARCALF